MLGYKHEIFNSKKLFKLGEIDFYETNLRLDFLSFEALNYIMENLDLCIFSRV